MHRLLERAHRATRFSRENGRDVPASLVARISRAWARESGVSSDKRYSPAECTGIRKRRVEGNPDLTHVSTSYVERNNLTMRMSIRRCTRLTNAFSKKIENHAHSVALHFMHYNFCRQHKSLDGISPAMAAGVTDWLWDIEDILRLVDEAAAKPASRGPYKKRNFLV